MNRSPLRPSRILSIGRCLVGAPPSRRGGLRRRPLLEPLEGRALLTATLTEFPSPLMNPTALVTGKDGNLWVLGSDATGDPTLTVVAPDGTARGTYTDPTPNAGAASLTLGPDGNLWFTETTANRIGKVTPEGVFTEYPVPNATGGDAPADLNSPDAPAGVVASPTDITAGPDGALWFTDSSSDAIGRITTAGTVTQYSTPGAQPNSLAVGPDGAIWFTDDSYVSSIDRLNLDGNGNATYSTQQLTGTFRMPTGLTTGPDGALWFSETGNNAVGRRTTGSELLDGQVTPVGVIKVLPILGQCGSPGGLTFDAAGNLWVAGDGGLARVTPQGLTTVVTLPGAPAMTTSGITTGPDGAIWFTDATTNRVGRIDPTAVTTLPTDHPLSASFVQDGQAVSDDALTFSDTAAIFWDGNPAAVSSEFTAQIAWGDGTTSAGTVTQDYDQRFVVKGTHTYAQPGTYDATVKITDVNPAATPQPEVLTMQARITIGAPLPTSSSVAPPVTTPVATPIFRVLSVGPGVNRVGAASTGVPGANSTGGRVTPVVTGKKTVTPAVSGPTELALFRAGYIKSWYMAAHENAGTPTVVAAPKAHHVVAVKKPVKLVSKKVHGAH